VEDGISELVVYRAKQVRNPRPESERWLKQPLRRALCSQICGLMLTSHQPPCASDRIGAQRRLRKSANTIRNVTVHALLNMESKHFYFEYLISALRHGGAAV